MEYALYGLALMSFGFGCWCIGVVMGARATVHRITEELAK